MRTLVPFFALILGCSSTFTTEQSAAHDVVATDAQAGQGQGGEPSEVIATAGAPTVTGRGGSNVSHGGSPTMNAAGMPSTGGVGSSLAGMSGKDTTEHPNLGGMGGAPAAGSGGTVTSASGTGGVATAGTGGTSTGGLPGTSGSPGVAGAGGSPADEPQCLVRRVLADDPSLHDDCIVYSVPGCPDLLRLSLPVGATYQITSTFLPTSNSCDINLSMGACLTNTMTDHETHPVLFSFKSRLSGEIRITGSSTFSCIGAAKGEPCNICQSTPTSNFIGTLEADDLEDYVFDMQNGGVTTPQSP